MFANADYALTNRKEVLVTEYDTSIEGLKAAALKLSTSLQIYSDESRKVHNTLIPIHRIPKEILAETMDLTMDRDINIPTLGWLSVLSTVCTLWHQVIQSTPHLWRDVHSADPPKLVRKALDYSKSVPLRINFQHQDTEMEPQEFAAIITPHISRCRVLKLFFHDERNLPAVLAANAPLLESLILTVWNGVGTVLPVLFGGTASRLTEIAVNGISVELGCPTTLRKLQVKDSWAHPPSLQDMTIILRNNSQLEHLVLRELGYGDGGDPVPAISESLSIQLPRLRNFILGDLPATWSNYLLSVVDTPPLHCFDFLALTTEGSHLSINIPRVLHFLKGTLKPLLQRNGCVHIKFDDEALDEVYFSAKAGRLTESYEVDLIVSWTAVDLVLRPFIDTILPQLRQVDIDVAISNEVTDVESWVSWLGQIPLLAQVESPAWAIGPVGLSVTVDGDTDPPCPDVKIVKFFNWDPCFWYEVVAIAEHRYNATKGRFSELVHPIPVLTFQVKPPGEGEYTVLLEVVKDTHGRFVYELYR